MIRFFMFLTFIVALVAGVMWMIDPALIGMAPRANNSVRTEEKAKPNVVGDKRLEVGRMAGAPSLSGSSANAFRDPIDFSGVIRASADQEVSSQIERNLKEIYVQPGQVVAAGQVIAQLDDSLAQQEERRAFIDWDTRTKIAEESAKAEFDVTKSIAARSQDLYERKALSKQEYEIDVFRMIRAEKEWMKAQEDHKLAKVVWEKSKRELELHKLFSEVNGAVERVNKKKGETVRVGEPVATIVNSDRLWVEGAVDQQYVRFLRPGMRVQVFPERANPAVMELREHTEPITGLSISPDSQILASASKDGRVVLWDWRKGIAVRVARAGKPDVDFASVKFSPVIVPQSDGVTSYRLVAGCSDGSVQTWVVSVKPGERGILEVTDLKQTELKDDKGHNGPVTAVAVTPNGKFCASGGEDRQICFWNLESGKFLYALRAENNANDTAHRGTVTSLNFAPDGMLVSAAADRTLKKWMIGETVAELVQEITGRSADVKQVGISTDGKLALFDHEEELRVLNLEDFRTLCVLTARQLGHFKNLAVFSPQADMILTVTTNGRLQMWSTPERPEIQARYRTAYTHGITKNNMHILGLLSARIGTAPEFCMQSVGWAMTAAPQDIQVNGRGKSELFLGIPELWNLGGQPFRQLQTPEATTETCGVFAPNAPYLFTGGSDKVIRVWAQPSPDDVHDALEAVITFVGNQVEGGLVRVRAEMDNPTSMQYRLPVGTKVNLRAFPETGLARRQVPPTPPQSAAVETPRVLGD